MMKNFKRAISSFFTVAFAGVYMALNTTTAFAAMIDERPKTDDEVTAEALYTARRQDLLPLIPLLALRLIQLRSILR